MAKNWINFYVQNPNAVGTDAEYAQWEIAEKERQRKEEERKRKEAEAKAAEIAKQQQSTVGKQTVTTKAHAGSSVLDKAGAMAQKYMGFSEEELAHRDRRHKLLEEAKSLAESPEYQKYKEQVRGVVPVEQELLAKSAVNYNYGKLYNDEEIVKGIKAGYLTKDGNGIFRKFQNEKGEYVTESLPIQLIAENGDYKVPKYRDEDLGWYEYSEKMHKHGQWETQEIARLKKQGYNANQIKKRLAESKPNFNLGDDEFTQKARAKTMEDLKKGRSVADQLEYDWAGMGGLGGVPGGSWVAKRIGRLVAGGTGATAFKKGLGLGIGQKILSYDTETYNPDELYGGTLTQEDLMAGKMTRGIAEAVPATFAGGGIGAATGIGTSVASAVAGTAIELPEIINEYKRGNITQTQAAVMAGTNFVSQYVGTKIGVKYNTTGQVNAAKAALAGQDITKSLTQSYLKETGYSIAADIALGTPQAVASMANVTDPEQRKQVFYANMIMQGAVSIGANSLLNTLGIRSNKKAAKAVLNGIEEKRWGTATAASDDLINKFHITSKKDQEKVRNLLNDIYTNKEKIEITEPIAKEFQTSPDEIKPFTLFDMINKYVNGDNAKVADESVEAQVAKETARDMVVVNEYEKALQSQPDKDVMSFNKLIGVENKDPLVQADVNRGTELAYKMLTGNEFYADTPEKIAELNTFREGILSGDNDIVPNSLKLPDHTSVQDNMVKNLEAGNPLKTDPDNIANHIIRSQEIKNVLDQVLETADMAGIRKEQALMNIAVNTGIENEDNFFKAILAHTFPGKQLDLGEQKTNPTLENIHRWLLGNTLPNEELYGDAPMLRTEIDAKIDDMLVRSGMDTEYNKTHGQPIVDVTNTKPEKINNRLQSVQLQRIGDDIVLRHGSPHSFDKFLEKKIGTGEGQQAFGYGLYFTTSSDVAKDYARKLSADKTGNVYTVTIKNGWTKNWVDWFDALDEETEVALYKSLTKSEIDAYEKYYDDVKATGEIESDKNFKGIFDGLRPDSDGVPEYQSYGEFFTPTTQAIYRDLRAAFGAKKATEIFQRVGIDGIKYERNGKGQTYRNYVVFNPDAIEIKKRNNIEIESTPQQVGMGKAVPYEDAAGIPTKPIETPPIKQKLDNAKKNVVKASKVATPEELASVSGSMKGLTKAVKEAEKELDKPYIEPTKLAEIADDIKTQAGKVMKELDAKSKPTAEGAKPEIRRATAKKIAKAVNGVVPKQIDVLPLGKNITTYDKTAGIQPDDIVTVYRGIPKGTYGKIQSGDYVTTNKQLAKDYAGNGKVISRDVKASEILDDVTEPLGEEYILRLGVLPKQEAKPTEVVNPKQEAKRLLDVAYAQKLKKSIATSELTLRTGEYKKRKLSPDELISVQRIMDDSKRKLAEIENQPTEAVNPLTGEVTTDVARVADINKEVHTAANDFVAVVSKEAADYNTVGVSPEVYKNIIESPDDGSDVLKESVLTARRVNDVAENDADIYSSLEDEARSVVKEVEVLTDNPLEPDITELSRQQSGIAPGGFDSTIPDGLDPSADFGSPRYMEAVKNMTGAVMVAGGWFLNDDEDDDNKPLQAALMFGGLAAMGNMSGMKLYLRKMINPKGLYKTIFGTRLYSDPTNPFYADAEADILASKYGKNWENEYNPYTNEKFKSQKEMVDTHYKIMQMNNFATGDAIKKNFTTEGSKLRDFKSLSKENQRLLINLAKNPEKYHGLGSYMNLITAKNKGKEYIKPYESALHFMQKGIDAIKSPVATIKGADCDAYTHRGFHEAYHQVLDMENEMSVLKNNVRQIVNEEDDTPVAGRYEYGERLSVEHPNDDVKAVAQKYVDRVNDFRAELDADADRATLTTLRREANKAWKDLQDVQTTYLRSPEKIADNIIRASRVTGKTISPEDARAIALKYYAPISEKIITVHKADWDGYSLAHFGKDMTALRMHYADLQTRYDGMYSVIKTLRKEGGIVKRKIRNQILKIGALDYLSRRPDVTDELKASYKAQKDDLRLKEKELKKQGAEVVSETKRFMNSPEFREIRNTMKHIETTLANYDRGLARGHVDVKLSTDADNSILLLVEQIDENGKKVHYKTSQAKFAGFDRSLHTGKKSVDAFIKQRNGKIFPNTEKQKNLEMTKNGRDYYSYIAEIDATDRFGGVVLGADGKTPQRLYVKVSTIDTKSFEPLYNSTMTRMGELLTNILNSNGVQTHAVPGDARIHQALFDQEMQSLQASIAELKSFTFMNDADDISSKVDVIDYVANELQSKFNNNPMVRAQFNQKAIENLNNLKSKISDTYGDFSETLDKLKQGYSNATTEEAGTKIITLLEMLRRPNPFMMRTKNYDFLNLGQGRKAQSSIKSYHDMSLSSTKQALGRAANTASSGLYYQQAAQMLSAAHGYGMNDRFTKYLEGIVAGGTDAYKLVNRNRTFRTGEIRVGERVWKVNKTIQDWATFRATSLLMFKPLSVVKNTLLGQVGAIYQAAIDAVDAKDGFGNLMRTILFANWRSGVKRSMDYIKSGSQSPENMARLITQAKQIDNQEKRIKQLVYLKSLSSGMYHNNIELQAARGSSNLLRKVSNVGLAWLSSSEFFMNVGLSEAEVKKLMRQIPYDKEVFGTEDDYVNYLANEGYGYSESVMGRYGNLDLPPALQSISKHWLGTPMMMLLKPATLFYGNSVKVLTNMVTKGRYIDNPSAYQRYLTPIATGLAAVTAGTVFAGAISTGALSDIIAIIDKAQELADNQKDDPTAMREAADLKRAVYTTVAKSSDNPRVQQFIKNCEYGLFSSVSNELGLGADLSSESGLGNLYPVLFQDVQQMRKDVASISLTNGDVVGLGNMVYKWAVPSVAKDVFRTIRGMETGKYTNSYGLATGLDVHYNIANVLTGVPLEARHAVADYYRTKNPTGTKAQSYDYISRLMPQTLFNKEGDMGLYEAEWQQPTDNPRDMRTYGISLLAEHAPEIKEKAVAMYKTKEVQEKINREAEKLVQYLERPVTITDIDGKKRKVTMIEAYTQRNRLTSRSELSAQQNEEYKAQTELKRKLAEYYMADIVYKVLNQNKYKDIVVLNERQDKPLNGYEYVRDYIERHLTDKGMLE